MKIQWKCREEKQGWRINATLPIKPEGAVIQTEVVIIREHFTPLAMLDVIEQSTAAIGRRFKQDCA